MQSQSQIESAYNASRARSIIRHVDVGERIRRRRRLRYALSPGVLLGIIGCVWFITLPYPAEYWLLGVAAVVTLSVSLCLPWAVE